MTEQTTELEIKEAMQEVIEKAKKGTYLNIDVSLHFVNYTDEDEEVYSGDHGILVNLCYEPRKAYSHSVHLWQVGKARCREISSELVKELEAIHPNVNFRVIEQD